MLHGSNRAASPQPCEPARRDHRSPHNSALNQYEPRRSDPVRRAPLSTLEPPVGLQSFERGLEKMVDGIFSRAFKTGVRPVELGRRMMREMDERRSVDVHGRRIVPNQFAIFLSPSDVATFSGIADALLAELVESARDYAAQEGYYFMGPVTVDFVERADMRTGRFHVVSQMNEAAVPGGQRGAYQPAAQYPSNPDDGYYDDRYYDDRSVQPGTYVDEFGDVVDADDIAADPDSVWAPTGSGSRATPPAPPAQPYLLTDTGDRVVLGKEPAVIGRLGSCAIVVADLNASRRHAEVRRHGGVFVVADLGSTNGTLVNGIRIDGERVLHDGDVINVGAVRIRFEAS